MSFTRTPTAPPALCFWARCTAKATQVVVWKYGDRTPYCDHHADLQAKHLHEKIEAIVELEFLA